MSLSTPVLSLSVEAASLGPQRPVEAADCRGRREVQYKLVDPKGVRARFVLVSIFLEERLVPYSVF
jgi:hypothetical protein